MPLLFNINFITTNILLFANIYSKYIYTFYPYFTSYLWYNTINIKGEFFMLVVVGGMIGLEKTTLAEYLSEKLNAEIYYESVDDNPILPLYYTESDEEIAAKRYPFLLQLYFLSSRFETIKNASVNATTSYSVIDRSIYEDWYFAKTNYNLGRMSDLEFSIYEKLLKNMMGEIEGIPKKAPSLMVYLDGSFETVIDRIKRRGRSYEL